MTRWLFLTILCGAALICSLTDSTGGGEPPPAAVAAPHPLHYLSTEFENASPLWWEVMPDGSVRVHLVYDHERASPNRANGHWLFRV